MCGVWTTIEKKILLVFAVNGFTVSHSIALLEKLPIIESKREEGDPDGTQNEDFIKYT